VNRVGASPSGPSSVEEVATGPDWGAVACYRPSPGVTIAGRPPAAMRAFTSHQVGEPTATHVPADANRTNERRRVYACRLRSCPCPAPHQIQRRASIYSLAIVVCATPYVQAMSDRARVIRACLACFHCRQIAIAFLHIRAFPERPRRKHNSSCISHYYLLDRQRTSPLSKV